MNRNGQQATPLEELEELEDLDLLGVVEIALQDEREELRWMVERCDALEELRRRALVLAAQHPADRTPITGEALRAAALAEGEDLSPVSSSPSTD